MSENKNRVVIFNGACQHSFSAQKDCLVTLNAGSNVVSVEKLERLTGETGNNKLDKMASESFMNMVISGEIEILDEDAVVAAESGAKDKSTDLAIGTKADVIKIDIVKLGGKEAINVIGAEVNVEVVKSYLDEEIAAGEDARKTVVSAAEKAIAALEADPSSEDGDK